MNLLNEHYAKWNKLVKKDNIIWFHSYKVSEALKITETLLKDVCQRVRGGKGEINTLWE